MYTLAVPKEVQDRRLKICKRCPFYVEKQGICKVCKCFLRLKTKLSAARCPTGRWPSHKE